jgi:Amt family ammonium transporter
LVQTFLAKFFLENVGGEVERDASIRELKERLMNATRTTAYSILLIGLMSSLSLAAGVEETSGPAFVPLDTLWVLIAAFLVFFMQAGFAMVEAGLVRAKNAVNVLTKNLLDFSFASIGFFIFGYAIMFGGEGSIVGTQGWFLSGATSAADGIPLEAFWLFQAVFAGTAATIVSGAVAERMRFVAYLAYSFLITAFIYPVVGHWIWGGGWLAQQNFHAAGSIRTDLRTRLVVTACH